VSSASGELCYGAGDVVGIMVDVKLGKVVRTVSEGSETVQVAFFCNGVLARTASGLKTDVDLLPFVSLGSGDVVAEFTSVSSAVSLSGPNLSSQEPFTPTTPRDFSSQRRQRS